MKLLTVSAAAKLLGLNRHDVSKWFRSGELATIQPPGMHRRYTTEEWVRTFLESHAQVKEPESRDFSGTIDLSQPLQTIANTAKENSPRKPDRFQKGQWREQFRR